MKATEHEKYAKALLSSLSDGHPEIESLDFRPDQTGKRNAADAMAAILCHRILKNSDHQATWTRGTTYEWNNGVFNSRNITDRDHFWTNMLRNVADRFHGIANSKPVAYLFTCCEPKDTTLNVWAIPEPLLHDILSNLPFKKGKKGKPAYGIVIKTDKQRIHRYDASPDMTPYFRRFQLAQKELLVLNESRDVDASAKKASPTANGEEEADIGADDGDDISETVHL
jgi:hypothetical protein